MGPPLKYPSKLVKSSGSLVFQTRQCEKIPNNNFSILLNFMPTKIKWGRPSNITSRWQKAPFPLRWWFKNQTLQSKTLYMQLLNIPITCQHVSFQSIMLGILYKLFYLFFQMCELRTQGPHSRVHTLEWAHEEPKANKVSHSSCDQCLSWN